MNDNNDDPTLLQLPRKKMITAKTSKSFRYAGVTTNVIYWVTYEIRLYFYIYICVCVCVYPIIENVPENQQVEEKTDRVQRLDE